MKTLPLLALGILFLVLAFQPVASSQASLLTVDLPGDWPQAGHDAQRSNASPTQVDPPYCYAWKWYEAPFASRAQPVVSSGRLFIGSMDGTLFARDATSGASLWRFEAGSPIRNSPAVYNGAVVLFSTQSGLTYGLDAASGSPLWQIQTGSSSTAPLVDAANARAFVASSDGRVTAFNPSTGGLLWQISLGAPVLTTPALSADGTLIFTGTETIKAVALNASTGGAVWQTALQGQSLADRYPVVAGSTVLYRSQPLYFFHRLLQEGDATMDLAGTWATSFNPTTWANDWAKVRPQILAYLNASPARQTFFALNSSTGTPLGTVPVLYTYGNNDIANLPVVSAGNVYLTYRARHGIQTDTPTVHVSSQYDAELGKLNLSTLDISALSASTRLSGMPEWRMTSDEPAMLTMGGNILWVDNWERLGGLNVATGQLVHAGAVSNDWPECSVQCGPGSSSPFFPLISGVAYPFPSPRVGEGHQRAGAVIANNMVYWRVIEGGLAAVAHRAGSSCPAPQVWGPVQAPARPSYPAAGTRALSEYLTLDLTQSNATPSADLLARLRSEANALIAGSGHWMPFYLERGFSEQTVWPYTSNSAGELPSISYDAHGNVYWQDPGDLLTAVAMAYPYLDAAHQTTAKTYMTAEMGRFPPLQSLPYGGSGTQDWLKNGLAREGYTIPMRSSLNNWPPVSASLNALYGLWLWSKNTGDWSYAQSHWSEARALFNARTPVSHASGKMDYFADLAGAIGYYRLAVHFGDATETSHASTVALGMMNDIIANPQAYLTRADNAYLDPRDINTGWYAPALFGLTPEVGLFLREQTDGAALTYLINKEYGTNGNGLRWWYLTRAGTHAEDGETSYVAPNAAWSHFLGHAYLVGDQRETLQNWLDQPWGAGDLFSIEKLAAAIQAPAAAPDLSTSSHIASPGAAANGSLVNFTLTVRSSGAAISDPVTVTITLPAGLDYQTGSFAAQPNTGTLSVNGAVLQWQGVLPAGGSLVLTYQAAVSTASRQVLSVPAVISVTGLADMQRPVQVLVNGLKLALPVVRR